MNKELHEQLEELILEKKSDFEASKLFKQKIKNYFDTLEDNFAKTQGKLFLYSHTKNIENFIIEFYKYILRSAFEDFRPPVNNIPIAIVALGSFAREQLCLYSDVDIMVVYKEVAGYNVLPIVERILHLSWDSGLKIGHRVHKIDDLQDAANSDITIKTAMIESRFLYGSKFLWTEVENKLKLIRKENQKNFIKEKIKENKERINKYPISNEPNIKDGFGGLREDNTLWWILRTLYGVNYIKDLSGTKIDEEWYKDFRSALEFLFKLRAAIHFSSKKKNDVLRFDIQSEVAKKLKIHDSKRIQAEVFLFKKTLSSLRLIHTFCTYYINKFSQNIDFSHLQKVASGLYIKDNTLYFNDTQKPNFKEFIEFVLNFDDNLKFSDSMIGFLKFCNISKIDKTTKKKLFKLFYKPNLYEFLLLLYHAKVLKVVFPQLIKVIDLAQFDGYHKLPVDLHLIKTVKFLENIDDPFVKEVEATLTQDERALLKLSAFFHDSGKGRVQEHSIVGATIFERFLKKLSSNTKMLEIGKKLILYHTLLSNVALREDIHSDKVVLDMLFKLKNKTTLKLLYILTYADMKAVGDKIYSSFNADLLKELFINANKLIDKNELLDEAAKRARREKILLNSKEFAIFPAGFRKKFLKTESNLFFIRFKSAQLLQIANLLNKADTYSYNIENEKRFILHLVSKKEINLAWFLSNFLYLDLVSMDIFRINSLGKYFRIEFNDKIKLDNNYLQMLIEQSFDMSKKIYYTVPQIHKDEITIDFKHSLTYAKMNLVTKNQKGIMMHLIKVFDEFKIDIASAKINTVKNEARDIFLIQKSKYFYDNYQKIIQKVIFTK